MIKAIQINFAENSTQTYGRNENIYYQYYLECSNDQKIWKTLVDKRTDKTDVPHDYIQLSKPVLARYIRLTNYHVPDGTFAIAGLRAFGKGPGAIPEKVLNFIVTRNQNDKREVKLSWKKNQNAVGYNIRYGEAPDKLYHTNQVMNNDTLTIRSLNSNQKYYFVIDAFNEAGIQKGNTMAVTQ